MTNKVNIGLETEIRKDDVEILERTLATEFVLNIKLRNYHWNVTGIHFLALHEFFEGLYEESTESIDVIAERARILGLHVDANMEKFIKNSILDEEKDNNLSAEDMLKNLLADKETIIRQMRKDIDSAGDTGDQGTEDLLTSEIRRHEKDAWMIRSMI